jgi:HAE1 family hydrophobic/amphiphilic exporter-1
MIGLIILVVGFMSLSRLGLDLMPDLDFPTISVMTRYDGASSEDIEKLVTRPLEGAMAAVQGVKSVKSVSQEDVSFLLVDFVWGTDLDAAAQDLREALGLVEALLPDAVEDPLVLKFSLSAMPVLGYGVSGMGGDAVALRAYMEDTLTQRMERLEGVAQVVIMGGADREVRVSLDRSALEASAVSAEQVLNALRFQNLDLPAGRLVEEGSEYLVRTRGEFQSLADLESTMVGMGSSGVPVRVRDVAVVELVPEDVRSSIRTNREDALYMMVAKQSGSNSLRVVRRVKEELADIQSELPGDVRFDLLMDTGYEVELMAKQVSRTGLLGALLAILFMYLFLRSGRPTATIAVAIPMSLLATFIPIYISGQTLNLMTMGGLLLGVGMLVDNAVVVIENIFRHLEMGKDRKEAARVGAKEVAMAITASTLTTIAVFLPLFFGGGLAGQLVRGLAMVVAFALASSLLVAITIVPMLASVLFALAEGRREEGKRFNALRGRYKKVLVWALEHRWRTLGGAAAIFVVSLALTPIMGAEFLPTGDQPLVFGKISFPVGTPMEVTERAAGRIESIAASIDAVQSVGVVVGINEDDAGAGMSEMNPSGVHEAVVFMRLKEERSMTQQKVMQLLRESVPPTDEMDVEFMDMGQAMMSGGSVKPVELRLFGPDLDRLYSLAQEVQAKIEGTKGLVDLSISLQPAKPEQHLRIDREKAASYGLTVGEIARAVETATLGGLAGIYRTGGDEHMVRVRYREDDRDSADVLLRTLIPTRAGFSVPLAQVAHFEKGLGAVRITRDDRSRRVSVQGNIEGRDLGSVVADVRDIIEPIRSSLPAGYHIEFGGSYEDMLDAFVTLAKALVLAILLVYLVMAAQFEAFVHPLVIMFSMPLALVGVVIVGFLAGNPISVATFVGTIMLAGIVVNNGIVMVDYINQLRRTGLTRREAVVQGGTVRLRAVLITSGTTIAGLLPMAIFPGQQGQVTAAMALTVAGGLAASTFLTLVVVPVVYELLDDFGARTGSRIFRVVHRDEAEAA